MNIRLRMAIEDWDREVEAECVRLIEEGNPPFDAMEMAQKIVSNRRAEQREQRAEKGKP